MIVTSAVGRSGPSITGATAHIVVVKTDPGYQPNPGHTGTGTAIVAAC